MFSNSQNNIFTDDMEFALGASCSEFSVPNHLASLPYMLDDFEKKYDNVQSSFEEKLQADKKVNVMDDSCHELGLRSNPLAH